MFNFNYLFKIISIISIIALLNSCGALKPDWSKTAEPSGKKRARQNVQEGKGTFGFEFKKGSGETLFASSNPLGELH